MTDVQIQEKLATIFRQVFDDESIEIRPELTAKDVERWDSLSHVDMIVLVEESFAIRLPTREVVNMKNVGDLIKSIHAKLS